MFVADKIHVMRMTEPQSKPDREMVSARRRIGKIMFLIGLIVVGMTVASLVILSAAAYGGYDVQLTSYSNIMTPIIVVGFLILLVGLALAVLPEGPSKDGLWVLKTGPYIK